MPKNVAIVYPYVAHYREPLFERLLDRNSNASLKNRYWLFSDFQSNVPSLRLVDPCRSFENDGSWQWRRLTNLWLPGGALWQKGVISLAFSSRLDVIVFLGDAHYLSSWVGCLLARLKGKKVLMWTHGVRVKESGLKAIVRLAFYQLSDGLLLYGKRAKALLGEMGIREEKMRVIFNSLDYQAQRDRAESISRSEARRLVDELFAIPGRHRVIYSGRLVKGKKLGLLVSAIAKLRRRGNAVTLLIVGDGPEEESLRELVSNCALGEFALMVGACYDERLLARYFLASDLAVIPAAAGLSVMHAMAYGVPVITDNDFSRHGPEVEAIVPGVTGGFFESDSASSLAETLESWLIGGFSEDASIQCLRIVEESYTPNAQLRFIEDAIDDLAG